jgi:hypothetical protein
MVSRTSHGHLLRLSGPIADSQGGAARPSLPLASFGRTHQVRYPDLIAHRSAPSGALPHEPPMQASSHPMRSSSRLLSTSCVCPGTRSRPSTTPWHNAPSAIPTSPDLLPCQALGPSLPPASSLPWANHATATLPLRSSSSMRAWRRSPNAASTTLGPLALPEPQISPADVRGMAGGIDPTYLVGPQQLSATTHQAAVRVLPFKWSRTLCRGWQHRTPYNASLDPNALQRCGAPLLPPVAHGF